MQKNYNSVDEMLADVQLDVEQIKRMSEDQQQIRRLAQYLITNHGEQVGKVINESAVDLAIRLLEKYKRPKQTQRSNF